MQIKTSCKDNMHGSESVKINLKIEDPLELW